MWTFDLLCKLVNLHLLTLLPLKLVQNLAQNRCKMVSKSKWEISSATSHGDVKYTESLWTIRHCDLADGFVDIFVFHRAQCLWSCCGNCTPSPSWPLTCSSPPIWANLKCSQHLPAILYSVPWCVWKKTRIDALIFWKVHIIHLTHYALHCYSFIFTPLHCSLLRCSVLHWCMAFIWVLQLHCSEVWIKLKAHSYLTST